MVADLLDQALVLGARLALGEIVDGDAGDDLGGFGHGGTLEGVFAVFAVFTVF